VGEPAIHYLNQPFDRAELAALYRTADVMVVTPLRDGMNLVAKEFVAARADDSGALVLSEFAGAAAEMEDAFLVNPHDVDGLKETLLRAMSTPPADLRRRMAARAYLSELDHTGRLAEGLQPADATLRPARTVPRQRTAPPGTPRTGPVEQRRPSA
jgi:trehalose 6-phosphate synthase